MKTELFIIIASIITIGLNVISMAPSIINIMDGYNLKMSYTMILINISIIVFAIVQAYIAISLKNNK